MPSNPEQFNVALSCWQQSTVWSLDSVPDSLHDARMSYYDAVIAILTILVSLALVILLVGAAWWLMWKVGNGFMNFHWTNSIIQNEHSFSCFCRDSSLSTRSFFRQVKKKNTNLHREGKWEKNREREREMSDKAPPPGPAPAQPLAPGNYDRACNDPPPFSYSTSATAQPVTANRSQLISFAF